VTLHSGNPKSGRCMRHWVHLCNSGALSAELISNLPKPRFSVENLLGFSLSRTPTTKPPLPRMPTKVRSIILDNGDVGELFGEYTEAQIYVSKYADDINAHLGSERVVTGRDSTCDYNVLADGVTSRWTGVNVTAEDWDACFDNEGRMNVTETEIKSRIYAGVFSSNSGC
jgi:hypothetical protein